MQPMETAPKDGRVICVLGPHGWRRAYYVDCSWLNDGTPDAWRPEKPHADDIELHQARGWKPAPQ